MRADSNATWTSGEPVSFVPRPYSEMIPAFCSVDSDMSLITP